VAIGSNTISLKFDEVVSFFVVEEDETEEHGRTKHR
jgi:hypothetical protein